MGCNPGNGMIMNHGGHGGGPMSGGGGHHNQHQPFRPGGGSGGMRPGGGQMGGGGGHGGQNGGGGGFSNFCMQNNINTGFNGSNMMNPGGSGKMFVYLSQKGPLPARPHLDASRKAEAVNASLADFYKLRIN